MLLVLVEQRGLSGPRTWLLAVESNSLSDVLAYVSQQHLNGVVKE